MQIHDYFHILTGYLTDGGGEMALQAFTLAQRRLPDGSVAASEVLHVGGLVAGGVVGPMATEVIAAYDAPFPDERYKARVRAFPDLIAQSADNPASGDN